jgi:hypothetical protein
MRFRSPIQHLCTMAAPKSQYHYLRLSFEWKSTPELFLIEVAITKKYRGRDRAIKRLRSSQLLSSCPLQASSALRMVTYFVNRCFVGISIRR